MSKKFPEPFNVLITGMTHEGRGIARHDNKVIFVFGALLDEELKIQIVHRSRRFEEAHIIEVIKASPLRITPKCVHFGVCGGCQLQHIDTPTQMQFKQSWLHEQLVHQAKVNPKNWLEPLTANSWGYRKKGRLGVRYVFKKEMLLVGFREQFSNKIALINQCEVLDERVGKHLDTLKASIQALTCFDKIAQIEVSIGENNVGLIIRNLVPLTLEDENQLKQLGDAGFTIYLQPKGPDTVTKLWPTDTPFELTYKLLDQNLCYHFHPLDFTQVNWQINQKMVNQALRLLAPDENDVILDLFSGLGNFSLPLAQIAKRVVGIEGSDAMVARARSNAKLNELQNVTFYAADLTQDIKQHAWANVSFTKLLLDPPRSGASELINQILPLKIPRILYVSCNPATFSRDAALLQQGGYELSDVGIMDMFPQTAHVETMGLFNYQQG